MRDSRVILYLPDLAASLRAAPSSRLPVLEKFLARASSHAVADGAVLLADAFGLPAQEFPLAAIEHLGLSGVRDSGNWWRADPVHLLVDRDQVAMLPRSALNVTADEARTLVATFNETYAADGFLLEEPRPETWYLRVPVTWHCRTRDPARVESWAVTEFMPAGPDQDALRKLMNEIQMLFHEHPVNQARERDGKPAINSLWLWGGGALPERVERSPERIVSDLPLLRGLAALAGCECESLPAKGLRLPAKQNVLIGCSVREFGGDITRLDASLLKPCWNALVYGRARVLECFPGGSRVYVLTRGAALCFWRKRRSLSAMLGEADVTAPD